MLIDLVSGIGPAALLSSSWAVFTAIRSYRSYQYSSYMAAYDYVALCFAIVFATRTSLSAIVDAEALRELESGGASDASPRASSSVRSERSTMAAIACAALIGALLSVSLTKTWLAGRTTVAVASSGFFAELVATIAAAEFCALRNAAAKTWATSIGAMALCAVTAVVASAAIDANSALGSGIAENAVCAVLALIGAVCCGWAALATAIRRVASIDAAVAVASLVLVATCIVARALEISGIACDRGDTACIAFYDRRYSTCVSIVALQMVPCVARVSISNKIRKRSISSAANSGA
jgi:hypothetical protein